MLKLLKRFFGKKDPPSTDFWDYVLETESCMYQVTDGCVIHLYYMSPRFCIQ